MDDTKATETAATATQPASWDGGKVLEGREPELAPGTKVGRFVVEDKLGAGGMGVVYAARDPKLNRKIAIKLVRTPALGTERHERSHARMLREAQAMARITHPNVATVYEVGEYGERIFIAMEFLDGETLSDWCTSEERSWQEVRDAYMAAGRGLAAAHEAGVVHRDFKPQNVLVGSDGRIVVTDFGLARDVADEPDDADGASPLDGAELVSITRTGGVVGTPRYMSPEQIRAQGAIGASSDQFSFCVSLYEGLYRQYAFRGRDVVERLNRVLDGQVESPPKATSVPPQIHRAIMRGLSPEVDDRYTSVNALLADLAFDPTRRRRNMLLGGGVALGVAAVGVLAYMQVTGGSKQAAVCQVDDSALTGVWDGPAKASLSRGLANSGINDHAGVTARVDGIVSAYAAEWKDMSRASCLATRKQGTQSEREHELRVSCLRRRLDDVRGLVALLSEGDAKVASKAVEAALSMPPISSCADLTALKAPRPLPEDPAKRSEVTVLQRKLAAAVSLSKAGQYQPALAAAEALVPAADAAGYGPLQAEVLQLVGDMQARTRKRKEAVDTLKRAAAHAEASGHDEALARARIALVHVAGYMLANYKDGAMYSDLATATIKRLGGRGDLAGYLELSRGTLAYRQGKYDEAARRWKTAVARLSERLGADHVDVARVQNNLALVTSKLGRVDEASKHFSASLATRETRLGPDHLLVANTLANLAGHHRRHGNHAGARQAYERAVRIRVAHQPDHPRTAGFIMSLAQILMDEGEYDESLRHLGAALAIYKKSRVGRKSDLDYPHVLSTMGEVLRLQGKLEESRKHQAKAIAALEESGDAKHERAGSVYVSMGMTLSELGKYDEAIAYFERPMAAWEAMSKDHLNLGYPLTGIGVAHVRAKRPAKAIPPLERALAIRSGSKGRPENLAETEFALAEALWSAKRDRKRAVTLAEQAAKRFERKGPSHVDKLKAVHAWLATRK